MSDDTQLFNIDDISDVLVEKTITEIYNNLTEIGYDPTAQIVGYLISGDPGYITSHKESRKKISSLERTKILESMLRKYINK